MGRRLRLWQPGFAYSSVERSVDRQFVFTPNHLPDSPLLRWDSDPRSLSPFNDLIPKPSIINIIGSSLVRAQRNAVRRRIEQGLPADSCNLAKLMWAEGNITHNHTGFLAGSEDDATSISEFKRDSNSLISRFTNKAIGREGPLLSAPFHAEPCLDDASVEQQFIYAATNVVKDGLVERVSQSPFFNTYRHFAFGDPLSFWWIEWGKYELAGGAKNKHIRPKDFLEWGELELTCLPEWEGWPVEKRQTRYRKAVKEVEDECKERRRDEQRTVVGVPALYATDPRSRPKAPTVNTRPPLCHTASRALYLEYKKLWREFVREHKKASWDYRSGYWEREFPDGSFRPPITTIYRSSRL